MDSLLNRYRNITVLLLVIFAQLILLAYQVKGNQDVRLIRVWAVTAVTPIARAIEGARSGTMSTLQSYILFRNLMDENKGLKTEIGKLKLENVTLRNELETADRVKALSSFQSRTPSKTIPARVIGTGTGASARVIFVDQGSSAGVMKGMAVITPDGIVGKITASYPTASQVLLITDPSFAAGVISQKHRVHGTIRGLPQGGSCQVDYVQNEEKVETGEMFFTSGDDRIFPKGFPVGTVTAERPGQTTKQIFVRPSGITGSIEEVLIVIEGVHQPVPEYQAPASEVHLTPPPPPDPAAKPDEKPSDQPVTGTEADRLRDQYKRVGDAQNHVFGEGLPGARAPDFTKLNEPLPAAQPGAQKPGAQPQTGQPAGAGAAPAGGAGAGKPPASGTAMPQRIPATGSGAVAPVLKPPAQRTPATPGATPAAVKPPASGTAMPQKTPPTGSGAITPGLKPPAAPGTKPPAQKTPASPGATPVAVKPPAPGTAVPAQRTPASPGPGAVQPGVKPAAAGTAGAAAARSAPRPAGATTAPKTNTTAAPGGAQPGARTEPRREAAQPAASATRTGGNQNP